MKKSIWTKEYLFAILVLLCVHTGPYLLLSVITVYGKMLSGSDTMAGMMASVFALSGLAARFLSAWLLDRYPLKKVLLIFTGLMGLASFGYIFTSSFLQAFVLRGIQGLAYGVTCTAMSTYIVKLLDPENRLEGIGYSSLTANIANAVCPAIAYALLGENVDHFSSLFVAVFLSVAVSFGLMLMMKGEEQHEEKACRNEEKGNLSVILLPFLIWVCMSLSMSSVSAFLSLSALEKGFSGIGYYFTFNIFGLLLSRLSMKKLTQLFSEHVMIIAMILIISASMVSIALVNEVWQLYCIALPFGFANGCLAPLINTEMVNALPDENSGFANAVFFAAADAGFIVGPVFWGWISSFAGYTNLFLIASGVSGFSAVLEMMRGKK